MSSFALSNGVSKIRTTLLPREEYISICVLISEITEYIKISSDHRAVKVNSEMWALVNVFLLWELSHDF